MSRVRVRVCYTGRVQGVGFRFNACQQSKGLLIAGFVRNEPDGSVLLEAEGEKRDVKALLDGIRSSRVGGVIRKETVEWGDAHGDTSAFGVMR